MNFSNSNYCSINEILADVTISVDDDGMQKLSPGYYRRQVRKAIEELSFETYFNEVFLDLDIPADLQLSIPANMWNIKDIFVYTKSSDNCDESTCDDCTITNQQRVFYKQHYISKGKGYGYTARNSELNSGDPFVVSHGSRSVLWYNVSGGIIMLSENCKDYDKIRIVANGLMAADISDAKIIPPFVREAVILYTIVQASFALKAKDVKYRVIWSDAHASLYNKKSSYQVGIWDEACYRLKKRDTKELSDFRNYLGRMNY